MVECDNLLLPVPGSSGQFNSSDVITYDGPAFVCLTTPSDLNTALTTLEAAICNIQTTLLNTIKTSQITDWDGTQTAGCFTMTPNATLNAVLDEMSDQICVNTTALGALATSDILTYDGTPTFTCFTPTASAPLNTILDEFGLEICANRTSITAKADLTLLQTYTTELRKDYVETGGDTANIGPGITIDIERTAGGSSVYYVLGVRDSVATETFDSTVGTPVRKRLSVSSDNYLDFDTDSDYTVTAVPNGNPAPAVAGMRMWKIVTDATTITGTTDLRNVTPIDGADICAVTITDAKMVANTLTSASMSNVVTAGTTNVANVTVDAAGRVTTIATDFDITGPVDLDLIQFQIGTGKWENVTVASLGIALPTGVSGQTLRHDGIDWIATSIIYNDGVNVGINTTSPNSEFTVAGNITPDADGTRDIGTAALGYSNLYLSSNIHYVGGLTFTRASVDQALFGDAQFIFGATSGQATAIMEVVSTTKGFLPPKMTTVQRNAISTPAEGLLVYDTDLNSPFYFDGGSWVNVIGGPDADWVIVSSDVQLNTTGHVLPNTDDTNDLGSSSLRFRDLYLGSIIDYNQNLDFKSGGTVRVSFENAGKVGIGTTVAVNTSALVEFVSTTSGFLPPRMTTAQKNAIGSPAEGLFVYDTDLNDVQFHNGTSWTGTSTGNDGIYTGSGLLSGATTITMGTNNLQFDSTGRAGLLFFDNTGDFVGIGLSNPVGALEVRQTSSTAIFRVYDTAFTNLFNITNTGVFSNVFATYTEGFTINRTAGITATINSSAANAIVLQVVANTSSAGLLLVREDAGGNGLVLLQDSTPSAKIQLNTSGDSFFTGGMLGVGTGAPAEVFAVDAGNFTLGNATAGTSSDNVMVIANGTAPSGAHPIDAFQAYSADIVAGNAAPHFRTELGDIIKLFKAVALTAVDATAIDAVYDAVEQGVLNNVRTRLNEIETLLKANGLLA